MNAPVPATLLADGLYFGLPEAVYRADPALGSTDMKRLYADPAVYWHGSVLNPDREPEEDTPSKLFGRAVHKLVLEGSCAFFDTYAATQYSGATKAGKEERAQIAAEGRIALSDETYCRVISIGDGLRGNPHLATAFDGPTEVSVIWTRDDVRRKARLDCLKIRSTTDLKTIAPKRDRLFRSACVKAIAEYRYDMQAAHYHEARRQIPALVAAGAVQGDHDPAWLARVRGDGAFVFVFLRVDGPPQTEPITISPGNEVLDKARLDLDAAAAAYRDALTTFGPSTPWITANAPTELDIAELPGWFARN